MSFPAGKNTSPRYPGGTESVAPWSSRPRKVESTTPVAWKDTLPADVSSAADPGGGGPTAKYVFMLLARVARTRNGRWYVSGAPGCVPEMLKLIRSAIPKKPRRVSPAAHLATPCSSLLETHVEMWMWRCGCGYGWIWIWSKGRVYGARCLAKDPTLRAPLFDPSSALGVCIASSHHAG